MHKSLSGEVALLANQEAERIKPTFKATGKKYGEVWEAKDQEDRRDFLRTYGVKVFVWGEGDDKKDRGYVLNLGDIKTMAEELFPNRGWIGLNPVHTHNAPAHYLRRIEVAMDLVK